MAGNDKPVLGVIAGPNGSGKTTITDALLRHQWLQGCTYINPDNIAKELGDWNDASLVLQAARQAEKQRERLLKNRASLAFETVFSAPDKLDFIQRAREAGFFVRFFFVATESPVINAQRIARRYLQGGHDVPIPKIIDRYYRSIKQCAEAVSFVDRLDVFDNSRDGKPWTRLFKYGADKQIKLFVGQTNIPDWSSHIFDAVRANGTPNAVE